MKTATDYIQELYMHVGGCPQCNTVLMDQFNGVRTDAKTCEEGMRLAMDWLQYSAKNGSENARSILTAIRESRL